MCGKIVTRLNAGSRYRFVVTATLTSTVCHGQWDEVPPRCRARLGRLVSDDAALVQRRKEPRLNAPIAAWEILGSYDGANQCMRELVELAKKAFARSTPKERREFGVNCIATDDPRLREKSAPRV